MLYIDHNNNEVLYFWIKKIIVSALRIRYSKEINKTDKSKNHLNKVCWPNKGCWDFFPCYTYFRHTCEWLCFLPIKRHYFDKFDVVNHCEVMCRHNEVGIFAKRSYIITCEKGYLIQAFVTFSGIFYTNEIQNTFTVPILMCLRSR